MAEIETENPEKSTYYVDETGIDTYLFRENVRAKRGVKVYSKIKGKKFFRLSIVAGKCGDHIAAPMVFSGTADSALFEHWFENQFCPEISGNIAVLDNATIHRKERLFEIAERHDVILIFQPPYSPDLNKIENFWAWLKKEIRTALKLFDNKSSIPATYSQPSSVAVFVKRKTSQGLYLKNQPPLGVLCAILEGA